MSGQVAAQPVTRASSRAISRVPYLPGLDGMRALAVVAVMLYHADTSWLPGGFLGVEVFFIISGYLITLLLVAEHEKRNAVSLKQFWIRRARRLLPAIIVLMGLVVTYAALFARDELGRLRGDVVAGLLYVTNWYQIWIGAGYTAQNEFAPLRHLWSLAVEEQFYVFWPLVMVVVLRVGRDRLPRVGLWMIGLSLLITIVVAMLYHPGPVGTCDVTPDAYFHAFGRCFSKLDTLYLSTPTRMSGILLGAGMAMWWRPLAIARGPIGRRGHVVDALALLGLVALGWLMWIVQLSEAKVDLGQVAGRLLFQGGFLLTGITTVLVIAAVSHPRAVTGRLLGNRVLLWIGTRSYGLYLFHWPVYQAIRKEAGIPLSPLQFVFAMAITVVLTEMSFRIIEAPVRTRQFLPALRVRLNAASPDRRRQVVAGGVLALLLPVFAGVSLVTADVKPTDIEAALQEGEDATVDVADLLGTSTTLFSDGSVSAGDSTPANGSADPDGTGKDPAATKAPTTPAPTTLPPQPIDVFAVGDSVMLGAAPNLSDRGAVVDAAVSRQGSTGADILTQLRDAGLLGNAVVIHLGTNGEMSQTTVDRMMDAVAQVPLVVALTVRADRGWTAGNNALIRALPASRPNVILLDWEIESAACPGNCFASDGIHLNPPGRAYYTDLIWKALGRA
jgi:peptidoglycan/LPS O-acetylase OafA/YrhL